MNNTKDIEKKLNSSLYILLTVNIIGAVLFFIIYKMLDESLMLIPVALMIIGIPLTLWSVGRLKKKIQNSQNSEK